MGFHKCSLNSYSKDRLCPHKKKREREREREKKRERDREREKRGMAESFQSLIDLIWTSLAATTI